MRAPRFDGLSSVKSMPSCPFKCFSPSLLPLWSSLSVPSLCSSFHLPLVWFSTFASSSSPSSFCARYITTIRSIPLTLFFWGFSLSPYRSLSGYHVLSAVGKVILEAAILTCAVVISLTLYTFWAAKRGHDFSFLGPILFCSVIVLIIFGFIQILFPLGKVTTMIYGALGVIIFSGYIIYDTDNVIKQHSYDEYIWAAVSLYLGIINLFLALLTLLRAADS